MDEETQSDQHGDEKERKKILNLYGAFGAGLLLSILPHAAAAALSLVFIIGVLMAAGAMRKKSAEGSLSENHAVFIIRTIWIGSFFAVITLIPGILYLLSSVDNAPLMDCLEAVASGQIDPASISMQTGSDMFQPCMDDFMGSNRYAFIISLSITAIPVLLYFGMRFTRGLSRAMKGYRIANVKIWF